MRAMKPSWSLHLSLPNLVMTSTLRNRPRTLHGNSNVGRWNNFLFLSFLLYYPIYALSLSLSQQTDERRQILIYIYIYIKGEREEEHVQISKQKNKKKVIITWKVVF